MSAKSKLLTQEDYDNIALSDKWRKVELSDLDVLRKIPGIQRKDDLYRVFVSGDATSTKSLNNLDAILAMDVLVKEPRPKIERGEGDINAYHYVVTETNRPDLPYCLHGPFTKETIIDHWPLLGIDISSHYIN